LVIDGKVLVFQHGHVPADMQRALAEGVDFLCHGHTHVPRDERVGRTRIINPGALHRASKHTAALLDLPAGRLRFVAVPPA
jgi:hypothetical protein